MGLQAEADGTGVGCHEHGSAMTPDFAAWLGLSPRRDAEVPFVHRQS